jgi:hypothetical protein
MPSLSLRGSYEQTYEGLLELSRRNLRIMQEQARLLIDREVGLAQVDGLERARQWRRHCAGRCFPNLQEDPAADRRR